MSKANDNENHSTGAGSPVSDCSAWVCLAERYPKAGKRVLVICEYAERRCVALARWQPAGTIDGQFWGEYPEEWEDNDEKEITNPNDLWVEYPLEIEQCAFLENVVAWMPIPALPNTRPLATPNPTTNEHD